MFLPPSRVAVLLNPDLNSIIGLMKPRLASMVRWQYLALQETTRTRRSATPLTVPSQQRTSILAFVTTFPLPSQTRVA